ncbi:hypothetical protein ACLOJK_029343 [Asimina triloba]
MGNALVGTNLVNKIVLIVEFLHGLVHDINHLVVFYSSVNDLVLDYPHFVKSKLMAEAMVM